MNLTPKLETSILPKLQVPLLNNDNDHIPQTTVKKTDEITKDKINYKKGNAILMHKFFHWPLPSKINVNCPFCLEERSSYEELTSETEEQICASSKIDHKQNIQTSEDLIVEIDEEDRISQDKESIFDASTDSSEDISNYVSRSRGSVCECLILCFRKNKCSFLCKTIGWITFTCNIIYLKRNL